MFLNSLRPVALIAIALLWAIPTDVAFTLVKGEHQLPMSAELPADDPIGESEREDIEGEADELETRLSSLHWVSVVMPPANHWEASHLPSQCPVGVFMGGPVASRAPPRSLI
ncbi:MAG: hypothetical protein AAF989_00145 [Planctomycetota bacterium]